MSNPRKPTNLALLHGDDKKNPGRINRSEPVPSEAKVAPPFKLTVKAQEVWNRLAPDMVRKRVLTPWDVDAFAEFCEAVVILRGKRRGARREAEPGAPSPMGEYKAAVGIVTTLGSRFGLTPSDRAKIALPGEGEGAGDDYLS
jgi:phage terminase small subunit